MNSTSYYWTCERCKYRNSKLVERCFGCNLGNLQQRNSALTSQLLKTSATDASRRASSPIGSQFGPKWTRSSAPSSSRVSLPVKSTSPTSQLIQNQKNRAN